MRANFTASRGHGAPSLRGRRSGVLSPPRATDEVVEHVGSLDGTGLRIGMVVARFNDLITRPLLEGAIDTFERYGVEAGDMQVSECV